MINIKRAYQSPSERDGFRILVDRLWPRGVAKSRLKMGLWLKDIAPSHDLRRWFNHDPEKWEEFERKYRDELQDKKDLLNKILDLEKENDTVTLVYSSGDKSYNNAVVLKKVLDEIKEAN